jgi:hypothetical protein
LNEDVLELRRLESGMTDANPNGLVIRLVAHCPNTSDIVLDRIRNLLIVVLRHLIANPIDYDSEPKGFSIDREYWKSILPGWFVESTPSEVRGEPLCHLGSDSRWTLEGWLYWFLSPLEVREWRWWRSEVRGPDQLIIELIVSDTTFPWSALRWAAICAGASSINILIHE